MQQSDAGLPDGPPSNTLGLGHQCIRRRLRIQSSAQRARSACQSSDRLLRAPANLETCLMKLRAPNFHMDAHLASMPSLANP